MKIYILLIPVFIFLLAVTGCMKNEEIKTSGSKTEQKSSSDTIKKNDASLNITGSYVTEGYSKKNEGYDWVAVTVKDNYPDGLNISVRSRADKKKPTCTFDAKVYKMNDSLYSTAVDGKKVLFTFGKNAVTIKPEKKEDENVLYFYCSGGATITGTYTKINEPIDESQVDKTLFIKVLNLQDVTFIVEAKPKDGKAELVINPLGLKLDKQSISQIIDGTITDAEAEDLDADGSPEVVVYFQSGNDKKGSVIAASVLKKNSLILAYFKPVQQNDKIKDGYNGQDKFTLVERNLVQQFPIYKDGKETGKLRQIKYKLENGENTKIFNAVSIEEINRK